MKHKKILKIGIDCRMYSKKFTGIGRYINQLILNLSKIDKTNQYILFLNKDDFQELKAPSENFTKVLVDASHYSFKEQTKFLIELYKQRLDIMHFTNFNQPLLYLKKQITTIHDLTLHFYPGRKFKSPIYRLAYKLIMFLGILKSKEIISISENTKQDLIKFYPHSKKKISVIYNGIDTSFIDKSQKPAKNKKEYILYTGNWREHKNLPNLIKAVHLLKTNYNFKGQLTLTGNPNPLYPEPLELIKKFHLEKTVNQVGLVSEKKLKELYENATIYAFPSLYEGFGLPILESFACQTPVACSRIACLPEIAQNAAIYFDPTSPSDIAEKLNKLLQNKQLQEDLIQKGKVRLKHFSFLKMTKQTHQLYLKTTLNV